MLYRLLPQAHSDQGIGNIALRHALYIIKMIFFRIFQAVIVGAERQHPVILPVGHRSHHIMCVGQQLVHPGIFQAADTLCKTLHGVLILALLPITLRQIIESKPCQLL